MQRLEVLHDPWECQLFLLWALLLLDHDCTDTMLIGVRVSVVVRQQRLSWQSFMFIWIPEVLRVCRIVPAHLGIDQTAGLVR